MKDENLQKYQEKLELIKTHFDIDYLYSTVFEYERKVKKKAVDLDNDEISNLKLKIEDSENEIDDLEAEIAKLKKQLKK